MKLEGEPVSEDRKKVIGENLKQLATEAIEKAGQDAQTLFDLSKDFFNLLDQDSATWDDIETQLARVVKHYSGIKNIGVKNRLTRLQNVTKPANVCVNIKGDRQADLKARKSLQNVLNTMYEELQGGNTRACQDIRAALKACQTDPKQSTPEFAFWGTKKQDPEQFLDYLFTLFGTKTMYWRNMVFGFMPENAANSENGWDRTSETLYQSIPIWTIPLTQEVNNGTLISELLVIETLDDDQVFGDKNQFKKKLELKAVLDTDFLVVSFQRSKARNQALVSESPKKKQKGSKGVPKSTSLDGLMGGVRLTKIVPDATIVLEGPAGQSKTLFFRGCIIYGIGGQHYTVVFRCKGEWYFFNDLGVGGKSKTKIEKIADSYDDMLQWQEGVVTSQGTQYIYSEDHSI